MTSPESNRQGETLANLRAEMEARPPTYSDFLALAVAQSSLTEFTTDHGKWCQAVGEFKAGIKDEHPDFLGDVYIESRGENIAYSSELDSFLGSMRRSSCFGTLSFGRDTRYVMLHNTKAQIIEGQGQHCQEQQPLVTRLTAVIDSRLGLTPILGRLGN